MKIVQATIFYDEAPAWLSACMTSFAPLVDAYVMIDGGYALFPGALSQPASSVDSHVTILETAAALDKQVLLYRPSEPFYENEVEKRRYSIEAAKSLPGVDGDSWFVIVDSDYFARHISTDLRVKLMETEALVAEYGLFQHDDRQAQVDAGGPDYSEAGTTSTNKMRNLFRNIPELTLGSAHYVYHGLDPDTGEFGYLWGNPLVHQPYASSEDLSAFLRVEHRRGERIKTRNQAAAEFYRKRDELGIESIGARQYRRGMNGEWVHVNA